MGPIAVRFLITGEDSSGAVAVFEGTIIPKPRQTEQKRDHLATAG